MDDQESTKGDGYLVEVKQKGVVEKHRYSDREKAFEEIRNMPEGENLTVAEVNTGRTLLVEKKKAVAKRQKRSEALTETLPDAPHRGRALKRAILFCTGIGLLLLAPLVLLMGAGVGISTAPDFVPAPQAPRVDVDLSARPAAESAPDPMASDTPVAPLPLETGIAAMISAVPRQVGSPDSYPYTVHAGSYRSRERAGVQVEALREKGQAAFAAYVEIPGMGGWFRVFCGNHTTKEEAQAGIETLKTIGVTDTSVTKKSVALAVGDPLPLADALTLESRLYGKGFSAYAMPRHPQGDNVQVLVGAFQAESRAKEMLERLTEDGFQVKAVER